VLNTTKPRGFYCVGSRFCCINNFIKCDNFNSCWPLKLVIALNMMHQKLVIHIYLNIRWLPSIIFKFNGNNLLRMYWTLFVVIRLPHFFSWWIKKRILSYGWKRIVFFLLLCFQLHLYMHFAISNSHVAGKHQYLSTCWRENENYKILFIPHNLLTATILKHGKLPDIYNSASVWNNLKHLLRTPPSFLVETSVYPLFLSSTPCLGILVFSTHLQRQAKPKC